MKRLGCVALVLSLLIFTAGCASAAAAEKHFKRAVPRKVVIGVEEDLAPRSFIDNKTNKLVGIDESVAKEVCHRLGLNPEFRAVHESDGLKLLKNKNIDILWGENNNKDLKKSRISSIPYFESNEVILMREKTPSLADFKNKNVAVQQNSAGQKLLKESVTFSSSLQSVQTFTDNRKIEAALKSKSVDGAIMDEECAEYWKKESGLYILSTLEKHSYEVLGKADYNILVRSEEQEFAEQIQTALEECKQDGTFEQIIKQWKK